MKMSHIHVLCAALLLAAHVGAGRTVEAVKSKPWANYGACSAIMSYYNIYMAIITARSVGSAPSVCYAS